MFCIGSSIRDLKPHLFLFSIGIAISGALSIAQFYGNTGVTQGSPPSGLLMNRNYLAEIGVMCLVAMLVTRNYFLAALLLPAALVPWSYGALVGGGCALAYRVRRPLIVAFIALAGILGIGVVIWNLWDVFWLSSWGSRLAIYLNTLAMIWDRPWGFGPGNFVNVYSLYHDVIHETGLQAYRFNVRPRTVHNDFLTIAVETGIVGVVLLGLFIKNVLSANPLTLVVVCFLGAGLFGFPLFHPDTAFLAALVAGHVAFNRHPVRREHVHWGASIWASF